MLNIDVTSVPADIVVYGKPDERAIEDLQSRASKVITSLLGDKNQIWLGKPYTYDLRSYAKMTKQQLSPKLLMLLENSELSVSQFACSFRPAKDCQFVSASLTISTKAIPPSEEVSVVDVFPRLSLSAMKYENKFSIKPQLKLDFKNLATIEASGIEHEKSKNYLAYEENIVSFGVGTRTFGWDLNKTSPMPLSGSRDFFALITRPRQCKIAARLRLSALVRTDVANIPISTFFLSGSTDPLIEQEYILD